jgi:hypothetical protein
MGKNVNKTLRKPKGKFANVITGVQNMGNAEFRELLVGAGILTKSGTLTSHYKEPTKPRPKVKKKPDIA